MKVLKFGGGCLKDAESIQKLPMILERYDDEQIIIVLSAFGKITNMLEKKQYEDVFFFINNIMIGLNFTSDQIGKVIGKKKKYLQSSNSLLYPERVSVGEYLASEIIKIYLNNEKIENIELNATNHIFTGSWSDELNAGILDSVNFSNEIILSFKNKVVITQGFIASDINSLSTEMKITTLGREGSDYSAAIFGEAFDVDEVILFKDVDGIYSSDPKKNSTAKLFSKLTYDEAFKLCNNGKTVVHPKTINHLKEKKIPLLIKNFHDLTQPGTIIN